MVKADIFLLILPVVERFYLYIMQTAISAELLYISLFKFFFEGLKVSLTSHPIGPKNRSLERKFLIENLKKSEEDF